ncbi:hypothetical protein ACHAW6_002703 [Cyclotella cf. meneghiniana]
MDMGGITFLLGCAITEGSALKLIRKSFHSIFATMCQNNPPVQLNLLQAGHIPQLIQFFVDYSPKGKNRDISDDSIREKVVQILKQAGKDDAVTGLGTPHASDQATAMAEESLAKLLMQFHKWSLFLLTALLTADEVTSECIMQQECLLNFVCKHKFNPECKEEAEIREMGLKMQTDFIAHHPLSVGVESNVSPVAGTIITQHKNCIVTVGVKWMKEIKCVERKAVKNANMQCSNSKHGNN